MQILVFSSNLLAESIYSFVVREAVLLPWSFINVSLQFVRFCHGLKNISTYDCDIVSQIAAVIALWFSQVKLTRNSGNMTYVVVPWRGVGAHGLPPCQNKEGFWGTRPVYVLFGLKM